MVGWPRAADRYLAVLELLGGGRVAVLVLFHALGVDQVGNVDEHAFRSDFLAAHFFLQRVKQLVNLYRESPRLGLALALARRFDPKLGEVVPTNRIGKLHVDHGFTEGAITD